MKAKDKAKELIDRFSNVKRPMLKGHNLSVNMHQEHVKQCALICVDEILKNQPYDIYTIDQCNNLTKYWKEVKEEINKL